MQYFQYDKKGELCAEDVNLSEIANQFGTPCYVYSRNALENNWRAFDKALADIPHRICYAVKANSNIAILNILAKLDSGFDIVSIGELERVLAAGGDPNKIVFSGIGKKNSEITRALDIGIACFNVESEAELEHIQSIAKEKNKIAKIALRVNPNIDARTHPYIATGLRDNKFGIDISICLSLCQKVTGMPNLQLIGLACHIGSQLTELEPFLEAADCLLKLCDQLTEMGVHLQNINVGGGLGIIYHNENPPPIADYVAALRKKISGRNFEILIEPGRAIAANAGILLTRVEYLKVTDHKNFAIVDAGMNDLIRPALYHAWQTILPTKVHEKFPEKLYDIVGPVCESADFLGKDRKLALKAGDLLAVCATGAYGFSMSSNYNSRPRAAEVMVDGNQAHLIRKRETIEDLFSHEKIISG